MIKDGGPAFPVLHSIDGNWTKEPLPEYRGMTLRDYFAAKAMQGLLASRTDRATHWSKIDDADYCYKLADAMLAERNK